MDSDGGPKRIGNTMAFGYSVSACVIVSVSDKKF